MIHLSFKLKQMVLKHANVSVIVVSPITLFRPPKFALPAIYRVKHAVQVVALTMQRCAYRVVGNTLFIGARAISVTEKKKDVQSVLTHHRFNGALRVINHV